MHSFAVSRRHLQVHPDERGAGRAANEFRGAGPREVDEDRAQPRGVGGGLRRLVLVRCRPDERACTLDYVRLVLVARVERWHERCEDVERTDEDAGVSEEILHLAASVRSIIPGAIPDAAIELMHQGRLRGRILGVPHCEERGLEKRQE